MNFDPPVGIDLEPSPSTRLLSESDIDIPEPDESQCLIGLEIMVGRRHLRDSTH